MLEAREITIKYGQRTAVANISLALTPGEVMAVIGPNGAGKSTLLRALNGSLVPQEGKVLLNDKSLEKLNRRAIAKQITVVAQEAELRFPVTVFEFVLGGRFVWSSSVGWGWESQQDLEIASSVLNETELTDLSGRLMNELSGGERQRAVLARALATEAPVLLLDEPTANLDLSHQAALLGLVRQRCDVQHHAALVITHDINLAAQFSDVILLMKSGKLLKAGTTLEVLTPASLREVFDVDVLVDAHPISGVPRVTPVHTLSRHN
ncbi:MAG TPA: ABC transporter ATP-binding protein [Pyrinomonadaceae bacterium]|nr:ABC transporter ATP-binding protein [Pyrinomonadaceae bacterium]